VSDDIRTKAALEAGKSIVKGAVGELLLSPEEKAKQSEEKKKKRRTLYIKLGAGAVVALLAVVTVVGLLANLWKYAAGALVLGGVGTAGYFYLRPKVRALRAKATARLEARRAAERAEEEKRLAAERERLALEAEQKKKQALEDQLEALRKKAQG
jgi:uncharacterized protein HemX